MTSYGGIRKMYEVKSHNPPLEDLIEHIGVMRLQEKRSYKCISYLDEQYKQRYASCISNKSKRIDYNHWKQWCKTREMWREKIGAWSFDVVEYYGVSREVVWIAMSFVDRYIAKKSFDSRLFKMVSLTALYIAIKLSDSRKVVSISSILALSNADFSSEDIVSMETDLLKSLLWNVHPPTPHAFINDILSMLPYFWEIPASIKDRFAQYCYYMIELSALDYFFVSHSPSSIAMAAFIVAMDEFHSLGLPPQVGEMYLNTISGALRIGASSPEVLSVKIKLIKILSKSLNILRNPATVPNAPTLPTNNPKLSTFVTSPTHCNEHADVSAACNQEYYVHRVVSSDAMEVERESPLNNVDEGYSRSSSNTDPITWREDSSHLALISPDDRLRL